MRVLVAESSEFAPEALALLRRHADVTLADIRSRSDLLAQLAGVDVLWVRLRHQVDAEVLAAGPRLRAVLSATTGLDHIDLEAATARGVQVISLHGQTDFLQEIYATSEHTLALALALLRRIPAAAADVIAGNWYRDSFKGRELAGKVVGVVGYGRVGRRVASHFESFGSTVIACDPALPASTPCVPADELWRRAQLVTVHVPLTPATVGMIDSSKLNSLPAGAWLINTSRGELIDEAALLDALRSGQLAGAAVDVISGERGAALATHPLVQYSREHGNLLITPHLGGCTVESMEKTEVFVAQQLWKALAVN